MFPEAGKNGRFSRQCGRIEKATKPSGGPRLPGLFGVIRPAPALRAVAKADDTAMSQDNDGSLDS
jgi:hypothetical protein